MILAAASGAWLNEHVYDSKFDRQRKIYHPDSCITKISMDRINLEAVPRTGTYSRLIHQNQFRRRIGQSKVIFKLTGNLRRCSRSLA
jgi:hypothetical protein